MDIELFINEYRLFRQKLGEELGIKDDEMVLKFFIAHKNLQRINNKSSDVLKSVIDLFNITPFPYPPHSSNPDSEDNDDDPYSTPFRF